MSEENKAVVREVIEQAYNKNNLGVVEETHARDFIVRWQFPGMEEQRGPEATKAIITRLRRCSPRYAFVDRQHDC